MVLDPSLRPNTIPGQAHWDEVGGVGLMEAVNRVNSFASPTTDHRPLTTGPSCLLPINSPLISAVSSWIPAQARRRDDVKQKALWLLAEN